MKPRLQLLILRRVWRRNRGNCRCSVIRGACYLRLQVGNFSGERKHIGMVWGVECLELLLLRYESLEIFPAIIGRSAGGPVTRLHIVCLLSDHSFDERYFLLRSIQRLSRSVELSCKGLKGI